MKTINKGVSPYRGCVFLLKNKYIYDKIIKGVDGYEKD